MAVLDEALEGLGETERQLADLEKKARLLEDNVAVADEVQAEAAAALQAYLVRLGLPAEPLRLADPDLSRLVDLLVYGEQP